ncbi:hypothetical protein [Vitreimonas sp.]|uniref:hypothetical protein n=1 Tax=Vitreimonas sp. TaxID=3069702 RepID=UPI002ED8763D
MSEEQYKRDEAAYKENCQFARGLNTQIMQIPAWAITVTGGLWFAAMFREVEEAARVVLFGFAAFADFMLIRVIYRLRDVFESYLEKIKAFNPSAFATGNPQTPHIGSGRLTMVTTFAWILRAAGLVSTLGFLHALIGLLT